MFDNGLCVDLSLREYGLLYAHERALHQRLHDVDPAVRAIARRGDKDAVISAHIEKVARWAVGIYWRLGRIQGDELPVTLEELELGVEYLADDLLGEASDACLLWVLVSGRLMLAREMTDT